jgi:hypothetical protein
MFEDIGVGIIGSKFDWLPARILLSQSSSVVSLMIVFSLILLLE